MRRVRDIMRRNIITLSPAMPLSAAKDLMVWGGWRHVVAQEEGKIVGIVSDRDLHDMAVNTAAGTDRILTVLLDDEGLYHYELRLTTLSWFDLLTAPQRTRLDWSGLVDQLNREAKTEGGEWVADDLTDPDPTVAFLDEDSNFAPNATRPDAIKRVMAAFFTKGPHLPAGL